MSKLTGPAFQKGKLLSLRSFITVSISILVTVILLCSLLFYYRKTSLLLKDDFEQSITKQLNQANQQINEQIASMDSMIPLFLSDTMISTALESLNYTSSSPIKDAQFNIERQMSSIYYSSPLSNKNFVNFIYIINDNGLVYKIYTTGATQTSPPDSRLISETIDKSDTTLICQMPKGNTGSIYFARNIYSTYTGNHLGSFVVGVDVARWISYCTQGMDPSWFLCLYGTDVDILSNPEKQKQYEELIGSVAPNERSIYFQELSLKGSPHYIAAQKLSGIDATSAVAAPKELLFTDLNETLKSYLFFSACIIAAALFATIILSGAVTLPINRMIGQIDKISKGQQTSLPPMRMYHEFDVWADSFNQMLKQLDLYYNDNFQKQLLLKNAKIHALQAQMDPHFLFNVLNTIAWKAQMIDNDEIYQMVISLGEMLKMSTLFKEQSFIPLEKEMEYVKFYIYLQQMRFEDKISCSLQIPHSLMHCRVPSFCIQPLVENAIVHGIEPKKGKGKLTVNVIANDTGYMEISIADNGMGFPDNGKGYPQNISNKDSSKDSHAHIALKNLDKRLTLLFGSDSSLHISSRPSECTIVSFQIPIQKEETNDI